MKELLTFVDTHCHLEMDEFNPDRDEVIERAKNAGIEAMITIGSDNRSFDESANELSDYLFEFSQMNRRERIELRNRVERLSEMFDWGELIRHYQAAHTLALERGGVRTGSVEVRVV